MAPLQRTGVLLIAIIYDMQVTQSIPSNSYVKGTSNDIIFTYTSHVLLVLSIVKGSLEKYIRPYIDGRREYIHGIVLA